MFWIALAVWRMTLGKSEKKEEGNFESGSYPTDGIWEKFGELELTITITYPVRYLVATSARVSGISIVWLGWIS